MLCALAVGNSQHQRRTLLGSPPALPLSKSGWRPVVGAGPPGYGAFGAAPLHAAYKIPIPVIDFSSSRPIVTRDAAKLTSIAQSYRPTTIRTVQVAPNQPVNSYLNPFALPHTGISHYKIVQNFPKENLIIRNPHGSFARPHQKQKPKNVFDSILQQQQLPFDYKPHDIFSKPADVYARPAANKKPVTYKDPNAPEVFKPEVFELTDNTAAPQSVQQVKTQQQQHGATKIGSTSLQHYPVYDEKFSPIPASLLGTFSSFGVQSMKNRDPVFPATKTTYLPPAPTKQTIFNSFSFTPTFQTNSNQLSVTTPKLQQTTNLFNTDLRAPTQQIKENFKIDSNKDFFKPSPQDTFHKASQYQLSNAYANDITKLPQTYTTTLPTTTTTTHNSYYNDFSTGLLQSQLNSPLSSFYQQNLGFEAKIPLTQNSHANKEINNVYSTAPNKNQLKVTPNSTPFKATYEVTENYENGDIITHSSPNSWDAFEHNMEIPQTQHQSENNNYSKSTTTIHPQNLPEEYSIVTDTKDNGYKDFYDYDKNVEPQSEQQTGNNEPISNDKLKDYYYKISTPAYEENQKVKIETTTKFTDTNWDYTTHLNLQKDKENDDVLNVEALPTLPPNKHFRRPSAQEHIDKDRIRKRTKTRRRRPQHSNFHRETTTSVSPSTEVPTTVNDEIYTVKPRNRPSNSLAPKQTTPTVTTDLSTSALPTTSSTNPTVIKKKIGHRRPVTTSTEKLETTTLPYREIKDSPIMKLVTRPQQIRTTSTYEYGNETPDYTHKQDEKDTPTSDIAISTSENNYRNKYESQKTFSFHKDVKPIEAVTEEFNSNNDYESEKVRQGQKQVKENRDQSKEDAEVTTFGSHTENVSQLPGKIQRPKLRSKYDGNRPRFSVKDYRNRLSSTTSTENPNESQTFKPRFPQKRPSSNENNENATESRRKFIPKDPRHKPINLEESDGQSDKEQSTRSPQRQRATASPTELTSEAITQKISSRIRKRPKPVEESVETTSQIPTHVRRIVKKKIKESETGQSANAIAETTINYDKENSSEGTRSESAIMKIAKDDKKYHIDHFDNLFEHSKRVSDLTLAASKDYNTPGMFKTVSPTSRRIPNYFTIATDDPILPIEAFFPQLNQKKES
ncbi:hypothetical protein EVAR_77278_1 [Eumeta japonica]|uniref:Uncharacterized protein n=1 Tax=Eumeta variegata TaxID=151549 RepID=A0A4C1UN04_EUMVA|nr:hypothetical protein EVAR_77278_1 [Eumeta japonica]